MSKLLIISTDNEEWNDAMYHQNCVCGHALYMHAFTMPGYDENFAELRVSQCTFCGCEEFVKNE